VNRYHLPRQIFLSLVAVLYGVNGTLVIAKRSRRDIALYALAYVAMFVFFMVILGGELQRTLMFAVFAMLLGGVFHISGALGYLLAVVIGCFIFPFYRLPVVILLSVYYTLFLYVRKNAVKSDNRLLVYFFGISFVFMLVVFFPLLHFLVQRAPQDLVQTLFEAGRLGRDVREALTRSIVTSSISTFIILLLGLPLAYVLVRGSFRGRNLIDIAEWKTYRGRLAVSSYQASASPPTGTNT